MWLLRLNPGFFSVTCWIPSAKSQVQSFESVWLSAPGKLAHAKRFPDFLSAAERPERENWRSNIQRTHDSLELYPHSWWTNKRPIFMLENLMKMTDKIRKLRQMLSGRTILLAQVQRTQRKVLAVALQVHTFEVPARTPSVLFWFSAPLIYIYYWLLIFIL